jgi:hypothetical protein
MGAAICLASPSCLALARQPRPTAMPSSWRPRPSSTLMSLRYAHASRRPESAASASARAASTAASAIAAFASECSVKSMVLGVTTGKLLGSVNPGEARILACAWIGTSGLAAAGPSGLYLFDFLQ